jgi:hypothetical protein
MIFVPRRHDLQPDTHDSTSRIAPEGSCAAGVQDETLLHNEVSELAQKVTPPIGPNGNHPPDRICRENRFHSVHLHIPTSIASNVVVGTCNSTCRTLHLPRFTRQNVGCPTSGHTAFLSWFLTRSGRPSLGIALCVASARSGRRFSRRSFRHHHPRRHRSPRLHHLRRNCRRRSRHRRRRRHPRTGRGGRTCVPPSAARRA